MRWSQYRQNFLGFCGMCGFDKKDVGQVLSGHGGSRISLMDDDSHRLIRTTFLYCMWRGLACNSPGFFLTPREPTLVWWIAEFRGLIGTLNPLIRNSLRWHNGVLSRGLTPVCYPWVCSVVIDDQGVDHCMPEDPEATFFFLDFENTPSELIKTADQSCGQSVVLMPTA